jgi:hypothetical protein
MHDALTMYFDGEKYAGLIQRATEPWELAAARRVANRYEGISQCQ